MTRLGWFLLLLALMAAGTWLTGWWGVALLAAAWSFSRRPTPPWAVGLAAAGAWGVLLLLLPWDNLGRLATRLGGVFSLPPAVMPGLCLLFAALLGWSGARLTRRAPARATG
jgi:hypothetical protein